MVNKDSLSPVIRRYPDGTIMLEDRQTSFVYATIEIVTDPSGVIDVVVVTGEGVHVDSATLDVLDALVQILKEKFPDLPIRCELA